MFHSNGRRNAPMQKFPSNTWLKLNIMLRSLFHTSSCQNQISFLREAMFEWWGEHADSTHTLRKGLLYNDVDLKHGQDVDVTTKLETQILICMQHLAIVSVFATVIFLCTPFDIKTFSNTEIFHWVNLGNICPIFQQVT